MSNVFLSYSHSDSQIVNKIANNLQEEGIDIWFDRQDLLGGQDWQDQIEKALTEAAFVLVFISAKSLESEWVQADIGRHLYVNKNWRHSFNPSFATKSCIA